MTLRRPFIFGGALLLLTLALDHGALPALEPAVSWLRFSEMRLMALGVILFGLLRSGPETAIYALLAATLHAAATGPGLLGPTIIGYWAAGLAANLLARWFFLQTFATRFVSILALIALESWSASAVRTAFWAASPVEMQWPMHLIAAFVGTWLYGRIERALRRRSEPPMPLGRKRPH